MAILTLALYKEFTGITSTDATRDAALTVMIAEVNDAILRYLNNGAIEQQSYTVIMAAPVSVNLVLPVVPVLASSLQIYLNTQAQGDPAAFTSDTLLTPYTDYMLDVGQTDATTSQTGIVRNLSSAWGVWWARPPASLAPILIPVPGAIKAVFTAGYATVPPSIQAAASLIVSKLYAMRKIGAPAVSESLQAYSRSLQSTATANGILQGDPTIKSLLMPFGRKVYVGSYTGV